MVFVKQILILKKSLLPNVTLLHRARDFDGFFRASHEMEKGHDIWQVKGKHSLQGKFAFNSCKTMSEVKVKFSGSTVYGVGQEWH